VSIGITFQTNVYLKESINFFATSGPNQFCHQLNVVEMEFRNVGFLGLRETGVPGEKPSRKVKTNNKLTYGKLVRGEFSTNCAIPATRNISYTLI